MVVLLKRLLVLWAIPLGLVLSFGPLRSCRYAEWDDDGNRGFVPVEGLAVGMKVCGGIALVVGVALATGMYSRKGGIMIASPAIAALYDGIGVLANLFFMFGAVDLALVEWLGVVPAMDEDFVHVMGAFWVVVGIPILALFITAISSQTVWVTAEGVSSGGLFGQQFVAWADVRDIRVQIFYVPRKAACAST